ncbi:MAG TPA: hypothetical protein VFZ08_15845, partial [Terriglobia bacterium]|nr:hypothetical protein [Terriglobia bacterium]
QGFALHARALSGLAPSCCAFQHQENGDPSAEEFKKPPAIKVEAVCAWAGEFISLRLKSHDFEG